jgi:signal transduction histidine kinase/ActR/RegA family two-component response regulator
MLVKELGDSRRQVKMETFLRALFQPSGLTPHGFCLLWEPGLIWLHAVSDSLIGMAYYSIPLALIQFVRHRRDTAFSWIFWLFAAFILACGTTHFMSIVTLWEPLYWLDGAVKAITAVLSVTTAIILWPLIPRALALPSPAALREMNVELARQIAERDHAEEQLRISEARLRQIQKMETIGQLTGGVAHDFNNLLTVMLGGLDSIERQIVQIPDSPPIDAIRRSAAMATKAVERAATLTHRLLAFSRRQPLEPKPIDANRLVADMSELLRRTLGETIDLETVLAGGLWSVTADPNQLENSLLNLAVNARDAMPEGGKLTIETGNTYLDEAYVAKLVEPLPAGQYVMIAVSDTGAGMDSVTLDRAFEPFFTTKDIGRGTGLGLSQVYGFVLQSQGYVRIYSEPGQGTVVKLYLPRRIGADDAPDTAADRHESAVSGEGESVLVVEDHEDLRAYSAGAAREMGYRVFEAADAKAALAILDSDVPIDLLFTDVVLPGGMNGRQLADAAAKSRPDLKVLFTTGYTRNAIVHNGQLDPGIQLLGKPFTYSDLAAKLRAVLDTD